MCEDKVLCEGCSKDLENKEIGKDYFIIYDIGCYYNVLCSDCLKQSIENGEIIYKNNEEDG